MFGSPDGMLEGAHDETSEHRDNQTAEVCSDAAEGQAVVHALAQQGVQPDPHASLPQVLFQSVKELPYLRTVVSVTYVHVSLVTCMYVCICTHAQGFPKLTKSCSHFYRVLPNTADNKAGCTYMYTCI